MRRRSGSAVLTATLAGLSLASAADSQAPFAELSRRAFPAQVPYARRPLTADIDNDGDLDVLVPVDLSAPRLFRNDGDAYFVEITATHLPRTPPQVVGGCFVDADGDGDVDLALAGNRSSNHQGDLNQLWLNDGSGRFQDASAARLPDLEEQSFAIVPLDAEGDGDVDLFVCNFTIPFVSPHHPHRLMLNDGTGHFRLAGTGRLPILLSAAIDAAVGDFDGDGDPDVLTVSQSPSSDVRLFRNDGTGRFTHAQVSTVDADRDAGLLVADLDGDGDLDGVASDRGSVRLLLNDGIGAFSTSSYPRVPWQFNARPQLVADLDRDGDVDLAVSAPGGQTVEWPNDGSAYFRDGRSWPEKYRLAADLDGDGDADLYSPGAGEVLLQEGSAGFHDRRFDELRGPMLGPGFEGVAFADVDADGDLDAVVPGGVDSAPVLLLRNDGLGTFHGQSAVGPLGGRFAALADVDGDGDPDLLLAHDGAALPSRLLLNDGSGVFRDVSETHMPLVPSTTVGFVVADLDGDADVDVVELNRGAPIVLLRNDGSGRFTQAVGDVPTTSDDVTSAISVDVDGDGDLDLAFGGGTVRHLFLNGGLGRFVDASATHFPSGEVLGLDLVDIDYEGDGDADLVGIGPSAPWTLFRNDGGGAFVRAPAAELPATVGGSVLFAFDRDGDGDRDLIGGGNGRLQLLDNEGSGRFQALPPQDAPDLCVAAVDVDDDGDVDLVATDTDGVFRVLTNLRRPLQFARLARVGRSMRIDVHLVGKVWQDAYVVPVLSAGLERRVVHGLGVLAIDPFGAIEGEILSFWSGQTVGTYAFEIPPDPGLRGVEVFAQAIVLEGAALCLTNAQRIRFLD